MNWKFWRFFLLNLSFSIVGAIFLLVGGPYFMRLPSKEASEVYKIASLLLPLVFLVSFLISYKFYKDFHESSEEDWLKCFKKVRSFPFQIHTLEIATFLIGTSFPILFLKGKNLITNGTALLTFLWSLGTGFTVGWATSISSEYFAREAIESLKIEEQEPNRFRRKKLFSEILKLSSIPVVLGIYFMGIISYANARSDFQISGFIRDVLIFLIVFFPIILIGPFLAGKRIEKATQSLMRIMEKAGEGDLRLKVPFSSPDEIGSLSLGFNSMIEGLRKIASKIKEASKNIEELTNQIKSSIEEQNSSGSEQLAAVEEISSAIEELTHSASEVSKAASKIASIAEEAVRKAEEGGKEIEMVIDKMESLSERVEEIASKVVKLGEKSKVIKEILNIIRDISEETQLLSINAAIEAASHGEQGRRFGVVAAEMRRLSEESRESLEKVKKEVEGILEAVTNSVFVTELGLQEAKGSRETLRNARKSITEIREMIRREAELIKGIELSTTQELTASQQIASAIKQVEEALRKTTTASKSIDSNVSDLLSLQQDLARFTEKFKGIEDGRERIS